MLTSAFLCTIIDILDIKLAKRMYRKITTKLTDWKKSKSRKPLIILGARQVGKTYTLLNFAKTSYKNHIYINFEETPTYKTLFTEGLSPQEIIDALSIKTSIQIDAANTLIIFDEIQECAEALNCLKYFSEKANSYHICAAGSLLGVKLANNSGFPVGKVQFMQLHPMNFLEFLHAMAETQKYDLLQEITVAKKIPTIIHEDILKLFKTYLIIGGMPENIKKYIETKDFIHVRENQNAILQAYSLDFAKHAAKSQIMKIMQIWNAIPSQLSKENKKYIYSIIRKGARAKDFEQAIAWLVEAGLVHKIHNTSTPKFPLSAYSNFEIFKLYLLDVGLIGAMSHLDYKIILNGNELFQEFKGTYTENYVAQELASSNIYDKSLYYWTSNGKAEIDFLITHNNHIYPLEVKSGTSNVQKSLKVYSDKYKPEQILRTSPQNLHQDGNLINIPLYLISQTERLLSSIQ